jgi:hypothetical protein
MPITIQNITDVEPLIALVHEAADDTVRALTELLEVKGDSLEVLRRLKFTELGHHPLKKQSLNLVEQLNQTWTTLVTLRALPFLFERHPEAGGFTLNIGTEGGTDIVSAVPEVVAAEVFAAVNPTNNKKVKKDQEKVMRDHPNAGKRYVFFAAPGFAHKRQQQLEVVEGVEVWSVDV